MTNLEKPHLITLDVYSALLDVHRGLTENLQRFLGLPPQRALQMAKLWRAKQLERAAMSNSLNIGRTLFRDCTRQSLNYVCELEKISINPKTADDLVACWDTLPLWPEANDALLNIVRQGYDIAILSNGDEEMLAAVSQLFVVDFKFIFSSETAGFYKPHKSVYGLPEKIAGIAPNETLHIAGGANDVLGAVLAGLECVWSNKNNDALLDKRYPAKFEIPNLAMLGSILSQN